MFATRQELKAAKTATENDWLANMDDDAALVRYLDASAALDALGPEIVKLPDAMVDEMMQRSVFGTVDRLRAAR